MKTVLNFVTAALVTTALAGSSPARAEVFWTTRDLLADPSFFHRSEKVSFQQVDLDLDPDGGQRRRIESRLGYKLARSRYTIFVATTGGRVDGYAVFDDELGQHLPISFAVKISPAGTVERQEIVAYREARGDEVRDERFRRQFVGKSSRDAVRAGEDVVVVSGATISSRAMAVGVKRALVLVEEVMLKPRLAISATARRATAQP
ncbi:MAG: FMN-binding protein [Myxococcales bacterium]|nr:FMN-binding protein [Myxococcales bacterium]